MSYVLFQLKVLYLYSDTHVDCSNILACGECMNFIPRESKKKSYCYGYTTVMEMNASYFTLLEDF